MAYITPPSRAVGYTVTAGDWNQDIRANMLAMAPDIYTAAGDMNYGSAADTMALLPIGAAGQVLGVNPGATAPAWVGGMTLISDTLLTADTATIDLTSIPATYKHLMVIGSVRTDQAATVDLLRMRVNNNSTADDHIAQRLRALNASVTATEFVTNDTSSIASWATGASATARYFGGFTLWIYDYSNTSKAPSWRSTSQYAVGVATNTVELASFSGMLDVAGAVSRLTFFPDAGSNLADKTRITLYGVR